MGGKRKASVGRCCMALVANIQRPACQALRCAGCGVHSHQVCWQHQRTPCKTVTRAHGAG